MTGGLLSMYTAVLLEIFDTIEVLTRELVANPAAFVKVPVRVTPVKSNFDPFVLFPL